MAHLWCREADRNWAVLELSGDRLHLDADLPRLAEDTGTTGARLVRSGEADGAWVLLTEEPGTVRVRSGREAGTIRWRWSWESAL